MSNPCPEIDDPGCFGPFRVQLRLTFPEDYEEQWVPPPGGGLPIARVSEVQVALDQALGDMYDEVTATVTTTGDQGTVVRPGLVRVGSTLTFRGFADHEGRDPSVDPEPLPDGVQVWTAEVWVHTVEPPSAAVLDYAYIAGEWADRLEDITTGSGVDALVEVDGVWLAANLPAEQLDPTYPASSDRAVEIAAA